MKSPASSWGLVMTAILFFAQPVDADDEGIEYKIKAGYIYNFTKFISWPTDHSETFNLCLLGYDPFGPVLDSIETRFAKNRPIKVFRIAALNDEPQCHILFINPADEYSKEPLFIEGFKNTLTIGEIDGFAEQGGMIGFINSDGKIKLQINLDALNEGGLKVSAKLLEVAEIIKAGSHD